MWVKVVMAETIWLGVWGRECNIVERSAWRVSCEGVAGGGGSTKAYLPLWSNNCNRTYNVISMMHLSSH